MAEGTRFMMLREHPFYWATRIAIQHKCDYWAKIAAELPLDYAFCYEYFLLQSREAP